MRRGFLIVDDFFDPYNHFGQEWSTFERAIRRVLPDARIDTLDVSHPVFNSFFAIKSLQVPYPGAWGERGLMGEFYGIHESNDPDKRLMVVINWNTDLGDALEHAESPYYPLKYSTYAVQIGAYRVRSNAEETLQRARRSGVDAGLHVSGELTIVGAGPYPSSDAASQDAARLRSAGLDAVVTSRK